jgi:hypothetical protein
MSAKDPLPLAQWSAEALAEQLFKRVPEPHRQPCAERIKANNVNGKAIIEMVRDAARPGYHLKDHATFKQIFGEGDDWSKWPSITAVRNPELAMHSFIMGIINENASVVVKETQQKIFTIIDPTSRALEYDAYYSPNESWCIASGEVTTVEAGHGGGNHVTGFYVAPSGWMRLALNVLDDGSKNFKGEEWTSWQKAYHGTRGSNVESIVRSGLMQPGAVVGGVKIENVHGAAGAKGGKVPIYATPSIEYASHYIYTKSKGDDQNANASQHQKLMDDLEAVDIADGDVDISSGLTWENMVGIENSFAQFVFEVRVRPGSYRVQGNTIGRWPRKGDYKGPYPKTSFLPYDERCPSAILEWLIEDSRDIICTGVMIRQLPVNLKAQMESRIEHMRKLTGFTDKDGGARPRNYGTPDGAPNGVRWEWNNAPSSGNTLGYGDDLPWVKYDPEISAMIENSYQQYQRYAFIGKPEGAPGPYCIHFGTEWDPEAKHKPEQRRADADKKQEWRRRAIRRVAL